MMGQKTAQPKLYVSFSLDAAVPLDHILRKIAGCIDFSFVHGLTRRFYSHTGKPSVGPVVLFKLSLLAYLFNITSERRLCQEAALNLGWRWFLGYELGEPIPDHSVLAKRAGASDRWCTRDSSGGWWSSVRRVAWWKATCCRRAEVDPSRSAILRGCLIFSASSSPPWPPSCAAVATWLSRTCSYATSSR
jgi:hypothetical protein